MTRKMKGESDVVTRNMLDGAVSSIVGVLNKNQEENRKAFATKSMLREAVDSIIEGVNQLFEKLNKKIDMNQEENRAEFAHVHHEISDLKHDTPSMKEFIELKDRVDDHLVAHV
jgi:hypothetical protein